jgi:1,4-dihydroxy-2-naphthoate octaprenyltransferase
LKKSTLLHLRFPFSFFLLPIFFLACVIVEDVNTYGFWLAFIILHFMVYPASNGYNSYFDKDEESIGGLKNPPKVSIELYWVSLALDLLALILALSVSIEFTLMVFVYGIISKAYSHPSIRLKKYPITGWLSAGIFQGYFTYLMCYIALADIRLIDTWEPAIQLPGILASVLLLGSYPMTQVYQHGEDERRGDMTMSRLLGIKGTFHFTAIFFLLATAGFLHYFTTYTNAFDAILFPVFLFPVLAFFMWWYFKMRKNIDTVNYENTMRLNFLSSVSLNIYFFFIWFY